MWLSASVSETVRSNPLLASSIDLPPTPSTITVGIWVKTQCLSKNTPWNQMILRRAFSASHGHAGGPACSILFHALLIVHLLFIS